MSLVDTPLATEPMWAADLIAAQVAAGERYSSDSLISRPIRAGWSAAWE
jgi:hypothetical protein